MAAFGLQFGHGLGLGLHERPIISRLNSMKEPVELAEGMVFALETYCPASDGFSAARIEEEVVVTADGCRVLTLFPAQDSGRQRLLRRRRGDRYRKAADGRHDQGSAQDLPTDIYRGGGSSLPRTVVASTCSTRRPSEVLASVADGTVDDAVAAVDAAAAAAAGWAATRPASAPRCCAARSS